MRLDTIVAPATPLGRSALAIVRIDGPESAAILSSLARAPVPAVRVAAFTRLWEIAADAMLDECVAVRYEAPHSFTGNDMVELTLHGNPFLVERVIAACVALGARIAEPGEFTERAVLNGKMDLVQAESVADLINARTSLQARLSLSNLEGALSAKAVALRATLLDVISRLEAALDFSEEGYEFITRAEVAREIRSAIENTSAMADTYARGRATTAGLSAVILGAPNAGKSTLLNRLVGSERAIVTPIPGTTRDIVRETIEVGGLPVTFADTAGLRESSDVVERIGIARAREAARSADLVLYLIDATRGRSADDERELDALVDPVLVYTKTDLADPPSDELSISAVSGAGVAEFLHQLDELVRSRFAAVEGALVNERQYAAVVATREALLAALASTEAGHDEHVIAVDMYQAATSLGVLTGSITRDEVFASIFSRFCIGK